MFLTWYYSSNSQILTELITRNNYVNIFSRVGLQSIVRILAGRIENVERGPRVERFYPTSAHLFMLIVMK